VTHIENLADLEALYRSPSERVRTKKRTRLDDGLRTVIEASPFVLLATSDADGRCDVSPRGGPRGFVKVLDDGRIALPDLNGNNLIDSLRNIVANPHAALLVLSPGADETLRIDGPAHLTTDDEVRGVFVEELRRPVLAIVIEVEAVFTHCAKAFLRSRLWDPNSWVGGDRQLALEARYRQLDLDVTFQQYADDNLRHLHEDLEADLPGR